MEHMLMHELSNRRIYKRKFRANSTHHLWPSPRPQMTTSRSHNQSTTKPTPRVELEEAVANGELISKGERLGHCSRYPTRRP